MLPGPLHTNRKNLAADSLHTYLALKVGANDNPQRGFAGLVELLGDEVGDVGVSVLQGGERASCERHHADPGCCAHLWK